MADDIEIPSSSGIYQNYFILDELRLCYDSATFLFHDNNSIETNVTKALSFIEMCKAAAEFAVISDFEDPEDMQDSYVNSLIKKMDASFYEWCHTITIRGCYNDSVLYALAKSIRRETASISMNVFTTTGGFRLSNILGLRIKNLQSFAFDCRCTYDSDFSSNIYQLVSSKNCRINFISLNVTGFPLNTFTSVLHLICAATNPGSSIVIFTDDQVDDYVEAVMLESNFVNDGEDTSLSATRPATPVRYTTFVSSGFDRNITIGFKIPED